MKVPRTESSRFVDADQLERFIVSPENGLPFADSVFYGEESSWEDERRATVIGAMAINGQDMRVSASIKLPSSISRRFNALIGRPARGVFNFTVFED